MDDYWGGQAKDVLASREILEGVLEATRWAEDTDIASAWMRDELYRVLVTVERFVDDDRLWDVLERGSAQLDMNTLATINEVAAEHLEPLLRAFGYRSPPPPPVEELVSRTQVALAVVAVSMGPTGDGIVPEEQLAKARHYLRDFVYQTKSHLDWNTPSRRRRNMQETAVRLRGVLYQLLIPAVAAAGAAGATAGVVGPDESGPAAEAVKEMAKTGITLGAGVLIGMLPRWWPFEQAQEHQQIDPVVVHLTHVWLRIETLSSLATAWQASKNRWRQSSDRRQYGDWIPNKNWGGDEQWSTSCDVAIQECITELQGLVDAVEYTVTSDPSRKDVFLDRAHSMVNLLDVLRQSQSPEKILGGTATLRQEIRSWVEGELSRNESDA